MTDKQFEKELKLRLSKKHMNIYRGKKYDKVYELLLRYCHAKNVQVAPLVWEGKIASSWKPLGWFDSRHEVMDEIKKREQAEEGGTDG